MSTFVTGGSIQQFQSIVDNMNSVMPDTPAQTAHVFSVLGSDVQDVADHLDAVDRFLDSMQHGLRSVIDDPDAVQTLLSERGAVEIPADANSMVLTLGILGGLGTLGHSIAWLGPVLSSSDAAAKAFVPLLLAGQPLDLSAPSNLNRVQDLLRDKIIPFAERGPKVNLTGISIESAAGQESVEMDSIIATLRMIGVVR
jgi:hypothetical protein